MIFLLAALVGLAALLIAHFIAGSTVIVAIVVGVVAALLTVLLIGYRTRV